jgi:thioesterase domain-containing protein
LLALIDTWPPSELRPEEEIDDTELLAGLFNETFPLPVDSLRQLNPHQQLLYVLEQGRKTNKLPPDIGVPQALRLLQIHKINAQAMRKYVPQAYGGQVTLFLAGEQLGEPSLELSWSKLVTGELHVHIVPGNHWSMLRSPHVQRVAERLKACLQEVQADGS